MSWLSGWDKRIKLTIDNTKIDAALSHFPVTVILSSTHGDCVFDELTQDANRKKIAFTKSDGTTQLYGEIEKWDDANESAIIHVSLSGWSISSSADTDFYMYYDVDHADNDTYIGDIDSTPGHSVWDSNFKFVCHMVDETTSAVKDSTSNGNDGTKKAANEPIEATGKIGKGQDFDGNDDYIGLPILGLTNASDITIESIFKHDVVNVQQAIVSLEDSVGYFRMESIAAGDIIGYVYDGAHHNIGATAISPSTWYMGTFVKNGNTSSLYLDSDLKGSYAHSTIKAAVGDEAIGARDIGTGNDYEYNGIVDETRISNSVRSAAWIKATYNTLWDTLLTYGSEETEGVTFIPQIIMF